MKETYQKMKVWMKKLMVERGVPIPELLYTSQDTVSSACSLFLSNIILYNTEAPRVVCRSRRKHLVYVALQQQNTHIPGYGPAALPRAAQRRGGLLHQAGPPRRGPPQTIKIQKQTRTPKNIAYNNNN